MNVKSVFLRHILYTKDEHKICTKENLHPAPLLNGYFCFYQSQEVPYF